MYAYGKGVEQDYTTAVKWWKRAAQQGDVYAQYNLGQMYEEGKGVAQNYSEATKWYQHSAEQGYVDAQVMLGMMYYQGKGGTALDLLRHISG